MRRSARLSRKLISPKTNKQLEQATEMTTVHQMFYFVQTPLAQTLRFLSLTRVTGMKLIVRMEVF